MLVNHNGTEENTAEVAPEGLATIWTDETPIRGPSSLQRAASAVVHTSLATVGGGLWRLGKGLARTGRGLVTGAAKGAVADVRHQSLAATDTTPEES